MAFLFWVGSVAAISPPLGTHFSLHMVITTGSKVNMHPREGEKHASEIVRNGFPRGITTITAELLFI